MFSSIKPPWEWGPLIISAPLRCKDIISLKIKFKQMYIIMWNHKHPADHPSAFSEPGQFSHYLLKNVPWLPSVKNLTQNTSVEWPMGLLAQNSFNEHMFSFFKLQIIFTNHVNTVDSSERRKQYDKGNWMWIFEYFVFYSLYSLKLKVLK